MRSYAVRNVNHLFGRLLKDIQRDGKERQSRNGPVLEFDGPVAVSYQFPDERVLLNRKRLCNHVFHLFESLWMIGGRNDVAFLHKFNSGMAQYSDDGVTFNGAYGHRAIHHFGLDQFQGVIDKLRRNPDDRRAVVQLWDARTDLAGTSLDHPCNTVWYFKLRDNRLHMTACLRSNDAIYGAMGANVVHCTIIQEWIAGCLDAELGQYNTLSDSMHVYTDLPLWKDTLRDEVDYSVRDLYDSAEDVGRPLKQIGLMKDASPEDFMRDVQFFLSYPYSEEDYNTPFFNKVVRPMALCWEMHKHNRNGRSMLHHIEADDWRTGVEHWLDAKESV